MADNYMIAVDEAIKLGLGKDGGPRRLLIFDVATPEAAQSIHVDKRHYEIRYIGETESSVEIMITRKVRSRHDEI